jgi:hypothetical protein
MVVVVVVKLAARLSRRFDLLNGAEPEALSQSVISETTDDLSNLFARVRF